MPMLLKRRLAQLLIAFVCGFSLASAVGLALTPKKVGYFIAGQKATADELTDIASLRGYVEAPINVRVLSASHGTPTRGGAIVPFDYVAGTIPASYGGLDGGTLVYPRIDPDDPPRFQTMPRNQAKVSNGIAIAIPGGGEITMVVSDASISSVTSYTQPDGGS